MSVFKHYSPTQGYTHLIDPGEYGLKNLHLGILNLSPNSTYFDHSDDCEIALIVLGGDCRLLVGHNGNKANGVLGKRTDVFEEDACVAYIPHHTTYEVITTSKSVEIVICRTQSYTDNAAVIYDSGSFRTNSDYRIRIDENDIESEYLGEGLCFFRFVDPRENVTVQLTESGRETARVILKNNDFLILNEKTRAHLLEYVGGIYLLSIHLQ